MLSATLISLSALSDCKDSSVADCVPSDDAYGKCGQGPAKGKVGTFNPKCVGLIAIEQIGNAFVIAEGVSKPFLNLDKFCNYTFEDAEWRKIVDANYEAFTDSNDFVKATISEKCFHTLFEKACPSTNVEKYDFENLQNCSKTLVHNVLYPYGVDRYFNGVAPWGEVDSGDFEDSVIGILKECTNKAFDDGVKYLSTGGDEPKATNLEQRKQKAKASYLSCAEPYRWWSKSWGRDSVKDTVDCLDATKYQNYDEVVLNCVNDVNYPDAVETIFMSAYANLEKFATPGAVTVDTDGVILSCTEKELEDGKCNEADKNDIANRKAIQADLQKYVDTKNKASAEPMKTQIEANLGRIWQTTTTTTVIAAAGLTSSMLSMAVFITLSMLLIL